MNKKNIAIALALSIGLTACGTNKDNKTDTQVNTSSKVSQDTNKNESVDESKVVYASFYPIYNLIKQIAGDKLEVRSFANLKTESHGWEPSAKEIAELSDSKLIFVNGAGMEEWKDDIENTLKTEIVDTSKNLDLIKAEEDAHDHEEEGHDHENEDVHDHENEDTHDHENEDAHDHDEEEHHHHGEFDPHTWLSPINAKQQAKIIAEKLGEFDPENKDFYMDNYNKLAEELDEIIEQYKAKFDQVSNKKFIVPHEAYGYLARDFGLEQIPLASLTSTDDPDAKVMKEVTDLAKDEKIKTVFYEKGGSDKTAKTIANEIGADVAPLDTMEFASDEDLNNEVTYQEIIKENLENIYKSLS